MSFYLRIEAVHRPTPFATDAAGRVKWSMNFIATAEAPVAQFEQEIQKVLSDAGVSTLYSAGTGDTLIGPEAVVPAGVGPWIQILDTGGAAPIFFRGDSTPLERLSAQIVVRADDYSVGRTRALAVWRALYNQINATLAAA